MSGADPEKVGRAIADVEAEIGQREFLVNELEAMVQEQERRLIFLRNTRIPALRELLNPERS